MASRYPDLAKEWHPTKNIPLTPSDVLPGSEKKVWWQCSKGHEWMAKIRSRVTGSGCPICTNRKVLIGTNDLATLYPHLAKEWHPTKNGKLMPDSVTCGSKRKVWWQCSKGHEWYASVQSRVLDNTGCPVCAGRIIIPGENDMASIFPDIAKEWHPEKNNTLSPSMVAPFCTLRVWWRCPLGHDYMATVESRTAKHSGCPYCAGKKVLPGFNDLATCQPRIAAQLLCDKAKRSEMEAMESRYQYRRTKIFLFSSSSRLRNSLIASAKTLSSMRH